MIMLLLPVTAAAQDLMTLDEAIVQALDHNYSLKISRNDQQVAENNVTIAPFLPTVTGSGRQSQTDNNVSSSSSGDSKSRTNYYTTGVTMNWRLFDGLGMFTTYSRQKELFAMSSQRVKISV